MRDLDYQVKGPKKDGSKHPREETRKEKKFVVRFLTSEMISKFIDFHFQCFVEDFLDFRIKDGDKSFDKFELILDAVEVARGSR